MELRWSGEIGNAVGADFEIEDRKLLILENIPVVLSTRRNRLRRIDRNAGGIAAEDPAIEADRGEAVRRVGPGIEMERAILTGGDDPVEAVGRQASPVGAGS